MRVVELHAGRDASLPSPRARVDELAHLRSAAIAESAMGGYLVLRPRAAARRRAQRLHMPLLAAARGRISGLVCLVLAGLLTLFASGAPASCRCDLGVGRLTYAKKTTMGAAGVSPISTSAIEVSAGPPRAPGRRAGMLPERIVPLTAAAPRRIRLAAAEIVTSDSARPVVEVSAPSLPVIVAVEAEAEPMEPRHRTAVRAPASKRSASIRRPSTHSSTASAARLAKIKRAPRWARQMFDNPWQSSAFSYVR